MCEYCDLKPFETNCYAGISKIYIGKPIMDVSYWSNIRIIKIHGEFCLKVSGERYENTRIIHYCPFCGRKLE
jgi:hypothetical protein